MAKRKVFVERQDDIAVCKLSPEHKWFWTACYKEVIPLIETELELGECISGDFEVSNVKRLGKSYFEKERLAYLEKLKKIAIIENKMKTNEEKNEEDLKKIWQNLSAHAYKDAIFSFTVQGLVLLFLVLGVISFVHYFIQALFFLSQLFIHFVK